MYSTMKGARKCPVCGKPFIVGDYEHWVYRRTVKKKLLYVCSWSCYRTLPQPSRRKYSKAADRETG